MIDGNMYVRIANRRIALEKEETDALKAILAQYQKRYSDGDYGDEVRDTITAILTIFVHRNVPY